MKVLKIILWTVVPLVLVFLFVIIITVYREGKGFGFGKAEYEQTAAECTGVSIDTKETVRHRSNDTKEYETTYYAVYQYTFTVDGIHYDAENREFLCDGDDYAGYQEKKKDAKEQVGTTKTIYYNPENPAQYSFTFQNYDEVKEFSMMFILLSGGSICAIAGPILLILIPVIVLLDRRRKKRGAAIRAIQGGKD